MPALTSNHPYGGLSQVNHYTMPNGLQLLILEDFSAPVVSFQCWMAVGSRDEQEGYTGMAHLFEHLMFKETTNLKAGEFDRILEEHGVANNAATWLDWTCYMEDLPAESLELVMRLEADRLENMILDQHQLDTEREVVKNERLLRVDNDPDGLLYEKLYNLRFPDHPYGNPTIGWMEDIERIDLERCLDFRARYYNAGNATLVVVGAARTDEVLAMAERLYGHMPGNPVLRPPKGLGTSREVFETIDLEIANDKLLIAIPGPAAGSGDEVALRMVLELLLGSESSRLYRKLVEETELAVAADGGMETFMDAGVMEIEIELSPGADAGEVLKIMRQELEDLAEHGLRPRELEALRNRYTMSRIRGELSVSSRAYLLGHYHITTRDYRNLFRMMDHFQGIQEAEIVGSVRKHMLQGSWVTIHARARGEA